jgi:hypothetical protein
MCLFHNHRWRRLAAWAGDGVRRRHARRQPDPTGRRAQIIQTTSSSFLVATGSDQDKLNQVCMYLSFSESIYVYNIDIDLAHT